MTLDLGLAIAHHLLIFTIFGILFGEFLVVRRGMSLALAKEVALLDLGYGISAGLLVIIGFSRAIFAAKGWDYYVVNMFFWAKIATFLAIGLLSIGPTLRFVRWRQAVVPPMDTEVASVRRTLRFELLLFVLLPIFAAAMARGYG